MWTGVWALEDRRMRAWPTRPGVMPWARVLVVAIWGVSLAFALATLVKAQDDRGWLGQSVSRPVPLTS